MFLIRKKKIPIYIWKCNIKISGVACYSLYIFFTGFIIGNLGLALASGTLSLAYTILLFTILSICAISTNGAVEGGGAYCILFNALLKRNVGRVVLCEKPW